MLSRIARLSRKSSHLQQLLRPPPGGRLCFKLKQEKLGKDPEAHYVTLQPLTRAGVGCDRQRDHRAWPAIESDFAGRFGHSQLG